MDCVSSLPDDLLCHILSFLTTKQAALTSVLSKRWRNLFAFVSNLDIDETVFLHPEKGKRNRDYILQSFIDFVDRVLVLYIEANSPIKKFSLKCKTGVDRVHVNRWICNVLQRGVQDLDLFIEFDDIYDLPQEIFFSTTLVELKLRCDCDGDWWTGAKGTFLPRLKTLVIDQAWYCWENLEMLVPTFPVLEKLYMDEITWNFSDNTISNASLKELFIHSIACEEDLSNPKSLSFDLPSLVYLDYSDYVAEDYPKVNMPNLVEALLNISLTEYKINQARAPNNDEDDVFLRFGNVWKLMSGIKNVQKLYLSSDSLEVLSLCCESIPVFNNLKVLHIKSDKERGWQAMPVLLKNCPHLETLLLEGLLHFVTDKCGDACVCVSREDKGRSLISCPVKKLQIKRFRGTIKELEIIEHFLEFFPCLKKMEIYAEENIILLYSKTLKCFNLLRR